MQWQLILDEPYDFAVEPGVMCARNVRDMAPNQVTANNVSMLPGNGLLMLNPRCLTSEADVDKVGLDSLLVGAKWKLAQLSSGYGKPFAAITNTNALTGITDFEIAIIKDLSAIIGAATTPDELVWAQQTQFALAPDEGFQFCFHCVMGENSYYEHLLVLQWDNIAIHLGSTGACRVYRFPDRANTGADSGVYLVDEFDITNATRVANTQGWFTCIPVPGVGLLLRHSFEGAPLGHRGSSPQPITHTSRIIPWPSAKDEEGNFTTFHTSPVSIALNPWVTYVTSLARVRYPASGTFVDSPFNIGYAPSVGSDDYGPWVIDTAHGSASGTIIKADSDDLAVTGVDKQFRHKIELASSADGVYSPFVVGWHASWPATFEERTTVPLTVGMDPDGPDDQLMRLEWNVDSRKRFEGQARVVLRSEQGVEILDSGDCTFNLQMRELDSDTWDTVFGGIASWDQNGVEIIEDATGTSYQFDMSLHDMSERMREVTMLYNFPLDAMTIADSINVILRGAAMPVATAPADFPAITLKAPAPDAEWKFAPMPKSGDSGEHNIEVLLALTRAQFVEWRMYWDWLAVDWILEKRDHDTEAFWSLHPTYQNLTDEPIESDGLTIPDHTARYAAASFRVSKCGANMLVMDNVVENATPQEGNTSATTAGANVLSATVFNRASMNDSDSPDYLGRTRWARLNVQGIDTQEELNKWARRAYDLLCHTVRDETIDVNGFIPDLVPDVQVKRYDSGGRECFVGWIHCIHVVVDTADLEQMKLECSSRWETDVEA